VGVGVCRGGEEVRLEELGTSGREGKCEFSKKYPLSGRQLQSRRSVNVVAVTT
jgi:hypothetical protein